MSHVTGRNRPPCNIIKAIYLRKEIQKLQEKVRPTGECVFRMKQRKVDSLLYRENRSQFVEKCNAMFAERLKNRTPPKKEVSQEKGLVETLSWSGI
jgi:hypothetical protein